MRSLDEALDLIAYHPATPETAPKHAAVRDLLAAFITDLWPLIPDGPEKTTAIRRVWEAGTYANLAIAMTAPADTSETRKVARELPDAGNAVQDAVGLALNLFRSPGDDSASPLDQLKAGLDLLRRLHGKDDA